MNEKAKKVKNTILSNVLFWVIGIVLLAYAVFLISLLVWSFGVSMREPEMEWDDLTYAGEAWKFPLNPSKWHLKNYKIVFKEFNLVRMYGNSLLYAIGCGLFATATPCVTGYVVARFSKKYPFLNIYTQIVIICMIIPIVGSAPAELRMVEMLNIKDKIWGIWLMKGYFLGMYFLIFQGTYRGMPDGYAEAAKIDGAGHFTVFFRIYLPLSLKIFATILLIQAVAFWNDYQTPLLYLQSHDNMTLALFQYRVANNQVSLLGVSSDIVSKFSGSPAKMTTTVLLTVPMLIVFIFLNKYIMGNLSLGGLKE